MKRSPASCTVNGLQFLWQILLPTFILATEVPATQLSVAPLLPTTRISITEAVQFALEHSPRIDSARRFQTLRDLEYRTSVARMLPSLDLNTVHGLQNNIPIGGYGSLLTPNTSAPWYSSLTLGVTENLYDNGVSLTQSRIAELNQEIASLAAQKSKASLILDVSSEFYQFSLTDVLLQTRKQQQQILERQFNSLTAQYHQGLKTKLDFLRFKAQVQRSQIDQVNVRKSQEASTTRLLQLLNSDTSAPLAFEAISAQRNRSLETLFPEEELQLEQGYDFRLSRLQRDINEKNVNLAVRRYWPQVNFGAGITYSNLNYVNSGSSFAVGSQLTWNALIGVQFNFWDWGIRRRDVAAARITRELQENELAIGLLDTRTKMKIVMIDLSKVRENLALTKDLFQYEEENYQNMDIQYREGKVQYLDLITTLNNMLDAKIQFYSAYFEALRQLVNYRYYAGTLDENTIPT